MLRGTPSLPLSLSLGTRARLHAHILNQREVCVCLFAYKLKFCEG